MKLPSTNHDSMHVTYKETPTCAVLSGNSKSNPRYKQVACTFSIGQFPVPNPVLLLRLFVSRKWKFYFGLPYVTIKVRPVYPYSTECKVHAPRELIVALQSDSTDLRNAKFTAVQTAQNQL